MKKFCYGACLLFMILLCIPNVALAEDAPVSYDYTPDIGWSEAAIVVDGEGRYLWGYNIDAELPLASVTKVMTAVCALDANVDLDQEHSLYATPDIWYSQLAHIEDGDKATLRDLLQVLLVYSANDAAINIGRIIDGSETAFVERMNAKAQELGLTHTHFMNTHGLEEDGHFASAADLVVLGRYAMENYPFIVQTVHQQEVTITISEENRTFSTTDQLLSTYPGVKGIKTGSVGAGDSFLCAYDDGSVELYACVLCNPTSVGRWDSTKALLDWAKDSYTYLPLANSENVIQVRPFADNFLFDCLISSNTTEIPGILPGDGSVHYTRSFSSYGLVLVPSMPVGSAEWKQDENDLCTIRYFSRPHLAKVPAIHVFSLPLFVDFSQYGDAA